MNPRALLVLSLACAVLSHKMYADTPPSKILELPVPEDIVPKRFSPAPPPGVHPRILISPEDLPAIRERLKTTAAGKRAFSSIEAWLSSALGPNQRHNEPLKAAYEKLVAGDLKAMDAVTEEQKWWKDQMGLAIQLEAFVALIKEDAARGARAGKALVTYGKISGGKNINSKLAHQFDKSIGMAYDFSYPYMNEEDRKEARAVIAAATYGQESHGMGQPPAAHTYNFMPHGMGLLLLALAIEGEEGYDATIYPKSVEVMKNFLTYGIDNTGDPTEDTHYFNFGMAWGSQGMVAMAKRGDNLFVNEHYRRVPNWYAHAMEPFGQAFSMHQDTPNDGGGLLPNYAIMKWVWPDDPVLDFVWRNRARLDYSGVNYRGDLIIAALFPSDWKDSPGEIAEAQATQWGANTDKNDALSQRVTEATAGADKLGLPLSWVSENRQLFIARDKWDGDGLALHFTINGHTRSPSHTHSNSLDITLSALGRKWVIDRGFGIAESKDHSVVLIDGKGQGFFPAPGKLVSVSDDGDLAVITGDAKYPYDWMYEFGNRIGNDYRKGNDWQPETSLPEAMAVARQKVPAEFQERPWEAPGMDGFTHKAPYNVVEKAFRTAALRRGDHPYVIIADDIRKDGASHTYEWLLQVTDDLEIKSEGSDFVVLGSKDAADDRRLLVRMVHTSSPGKWELSTYDVVRSPDTGSDKKYGQGRRLKYITQAIEPSFRVLLYPHHAKDALPEVAKADQEGVNIIWPNRTDAYAFSRQDDGSSQVVLKSDTDKKQPGFFQRLFGFGS